MVKVWKDLNEMTSTQLPKKYEGIRELMEQIPKHQQSEGARKIYQRKEYTIYKVANCFIIHNTSRPFEASHTHLKGFEMAKVLIDCAIRKKLPKTRNKYLLSSLIRISTDKKFINEVQSLIDVRDSKGKQNYVIKK